jgi:hypothetical protein
MQEALYNILTEFGILMKLGGLIVCLNKIYICIDKHNVWCISYSERSERRGMLFNFAIEYAIRKVQKNQDKLELKWTHHFLIRGNINSWRKDLNAVKNTKLYQILVRRLVQK